MSPAGRFVVGLSNGLDRLAGAATMVILVALVGVVTVQVVARYVLNSPPAWTEEMARYAMIWAGLLGATLSFKRRFDPALVSRPVGRSPLTAAARGLIQGSVVLIYLLPILWYTFFGPNMNPERSFLMRHSRMTADTLGFPTLLVAVAVPIMIGCVLVHLVARPFEAPQPDEDEILADQGEQSA